MALLISAAISLTCPGVISLSPVLQRPWPISTSHLRRLSWPHSYGNHRKGRKQKCTVFLKILFVAHLLKSCRPRKTYEVRIQVMGKQMPSLQLEKLQSHTARGRDSERVKELVPLIKTIAVPTNFHLLLI